MKYRKVSKLVAAMLLASLVPFGVHEARADENADPSQINKQEDHATGNSEIKEETKTTENPGSTEEIIVSDPKLNKIMEDAKFTEDELKTKEGREEVVGRIENAKNDLNEEEKKLQSELDEIKNKNETDLSNLDKAYELKRKEIALEYQIKVIDDTLKGSKDLTPEELEDPKGTSIKKIADDPYNKKTLEISKKTQKIEKDLEDLLENRAVRENQPKIGEEVIDEKNKLWDEMMELSNEADPIKEKADYYRKRYSDPYYKAFSELHDQSSKYQKAITDMADDLRNKGIDPETDPEYMELYETNTKIARKLSDEAYANHMLGFKHSRVYWEMNKAAAPLMDKYFIKSKDIAINKVELEVYKEFKEGKVTAQNIDSLIEAEAGVIKKRLYERYKDYFENGNKESDAADKEYQEIIKKRDEYKEALAQLEKEREKSSEEYYYKSRPTDFIVRMWHSGESKEEVTEEMIKEKEDLINRLNKTKEESALYNLEELEKGLEGINKLISDKEKEISNIKYLTNRLENDIDSIKKIDPIIEDKVDDSENTNPKIEDKVDETENTNSDLSFDGTYLYKLSNSLKNEDDEDDEKSDEEIKKIIEEIGKLMADNKAWSNKVRSLSRLERAYKSSKDIIAIAEEYLNSDKIIAANRDRLVKLIAKQKEINKKVEKYIKTRRLDLYNEAMVYLKSTK